MGVNLLGKCIREALKVQILLRFSAVFCCKCCVFNAFESPSLVKLFVTSYFCTVMACFYQAFPGEGSITLVRRRIAPSISKDIQVQTRTKYMQVKYLLFSIGYFCTESPYSVDSRFNVRICLVYSVVFRYRPCMITA